MRYKAFEELTIAGCTAPAPFGEIVVRLQRSALRTGGWGKRNGDCAGNAHRRSLRGQKNPPLARGISAHRSAPSGKASLTGKSSR